MQPKPKAVSESQSSKELKWKDPNCYHEAVLFYRETFNLQMNAGFRRDVVATIKTYEDLKIWEDLVTHWGYMKDGKWHKRNPLDVKGLLTCFEFKKREKENGKVATSQAKPQDIRVHRNEGMAGRPMGRVPESPMWFELERSGSNTRGMG